jgi:hypothetical protein
MRRNIYGIAIASLLFSNSISAQVVRKGMGMESSKKTVISAPPAKYTIDQMAGKWQEVKRMNTKSEIVDFTDSLSMTINGGKSEVRAGGMGMIMRGEAAIDAPATLNIAGDSYGIRTVDKDVIVLKDDQYLRQLNRVSQFYFENTGKVAVKSLDEATAVTANIKDLSGKWEVYRRTAKPGAITDSTVLFKSITLTEITDDNTAKGEMVIYNGSNISQLLPCTVRILGTELSIISDKGPMIFNIYKAEGGDFVFGKTDGVTSYANKK